MDPSVWDLYQHGGQAVPVQGLSDIPPRYPVAVEQAAASASSSASAELERLDLS